jgi:hypothetical protein
MVPGAHSASEKKSSFLSKKMDEIIPLEEAIHTLNCITAPYENREHSGRLESIEETLSLLISRQKRQARKAHLIQIKGKLLRSIDTIKIALLRIGAGHLNDGHLKEKLFRVVERYNAVLKAVKEPSGSLWQKLTYHVQKLQGGFFDEEFEEIEIPTIASHKITQVSAPGGLEKIRKVLATKPCSQEADLFYAKAYTLLKQEHACQPILEEALRTLRKCSLEAALSRNDILSLRGAISPFPGETIELSGNFHRRGTGSVPIKESFTIRQISSQSGYPHPLQHIGISFSEKLLPNCLLRPALAPSVSQLFTERKEIAKKLESNGLLNLKAKELLCARKKIFREHKATLLPLLEKNLEAFFSAAEEAPGREYLVSLGDNYFEILSGTSASLVETTLTHPLELCEQKWLADRAKTIQDFESTLHNPLSCGQEVGFEAAFGRALSKCLIPVAGFLFSERLHVPFTPLDTFSQKMVAAAFQELKDFLFELEEVSVEESFLLDWIVSLIEKQTALFSSSRVSDPYLEELEHYFTVRARG